MLREKIKNWKMELAAVLVFVLVLGMTGLSGSVKAADQTDLKTIDIMFVHDTHSHLNSFSTVVDEKQEMIGGFARIKTLIDEQKEKDPDTLVVDGGDPRRGVFLFHAAVFRENMDACLADGADQSADQKRQGNVLPGLRPGCGLILHGFVKFTTDFHMQPSFAEKYVQFSGDYTGMFHVKHFETDCCFTEKAYRRGEHGSPENL